MTRPIICVSEHLLSDKGASCVGSDLIAAFENLNIEYRVLNYTNDYWVRDFMPVPLIEGESYSQYIYRPDYLWNKTDKRQYITEQKDACRELNLLMPNDMEIVFDGGNYVRCNDKVIMTDKVLMENPDWSANKLLRHLSDVLCADIILIPWDMRDPCGHADGIVAKLDDGRLLLNNFIKGKKSFYTRLHKILDAHFDVIDLSYDCDLDIDSWCYLNFLNLPNAILLPVLSPKFDADNDQEAIRVFEELFPHKKIMPIYAKPLIKDGGALHCATWEYYPNKNTENTPSSQ